MMRTLILNGSPKKKGDTTALIDEMIRNVEGEVRVISSVFHYISPCIDCRYCWHHSGCAIQDEMQGVYKFLEECDNVVIASPIWFSALSGPLMNLASRLQTYFAARYFRGEETGIKHKNGVLILVGAEKGTEKKAVSTAHTIFKHINAMPCVASVFSLDTNNLAAAEDAAALENIRTAAALLNQLFHEK